MGFRVTNGRALGHDLPLSVGIRTRTSPDPNTSSGILPQLFGIWLCLLTVYGCSAGGTPHPSVSPSGSEQRGFSQVGIASWYGPKFQGRRTASGETFNMYALTAAHKTLPLQTRVQVTNLENGRQITVRINDRGPFVGNRIIDLSYAAAKALDMLGPGTARVEVRTTGSSATPCGPYYVQVCSLRSRKSARTVVESLHRQGIAAARISAATVRGLRFWRVQAGPYLRITAARRAKGRIRSRYQDCFILAD